MNRTFISSLAVLVVSACGGGNDYQNYSDSSVEFAQAAPGPTAPPQARKAQAPSPSGGVPVDQSPQQFIAYTHSLGLTLPTAAVEPIYNAHIEACRSAGPARCLVTNSNLRKQDEERVYGYLTLRASEDWITEFNTTLDSDIDAAKGEISARNSTATDLTTQIVDTDARLQAQITLRNRLIELLENRDGELKDFLDIERELARVTGTINSIEANLKALKHRVSMSTFTINYEPKISSIAPSQFSPLGEAFGEFFYNMSAAFAAVITAFAVGLPWMILIGLMIYIWLRLIWPRVRRKKKTD